MIEKLYELLESIPADSAINIARRHIIMQKIYELEQEESQYDGPLLVSGQS